MDLNDIKIDERKVKSMMLQILLLERKNSKTKEKSTNEMLTSIQKIIEEELGCL